MASPRINARAERLVYRIAGLPAALSAPADPLGAAYARRYWRPAGAGEWLELIAALILWPIGVLGASSWYTLRNGAIIRRRYGKGAARQFAEQIGIYFSAGVLAPWYYIFSLHEDDGRQRARSYLQRFETKSAIFPRLKRKGGSPLTDKRRFAQHCSEHGIRTVPTIAELDGAAHVASLPDEDLFVKRSKGRGGKGAERWDRIAPLTFSNPSGERLSAAALLDRLVERSKVERLIVQPRMHAHRDLLEITAGALPTVRIVTCLDEAGEPELIGAVFRMSIGPNSTVDNLHAGGIAAAVDPPSGRLSRATNLGADARLGWLSVHPDTQAPVEGRVLPLWEETKRAALSAHRAFRDRVVIGWDVGILDDGPIVIEGNGNPDMDILQRFMPYGLKRHRFADLLAYHLEQRLCAPPPAALDQAHEASRFHPHQRQADAGSAGLGAQLPQE